MVKLLSHIKSKIALYKVNRELKRLDELNTKWDVFYKAIENYFSVVSGKLKDKN